MYTCLHCIPVDFKHFINPGVMNKALFDTQLKNMCYPWQLPQCLKISGHYLRYFSKLLKGGLEKFCGHFIRQITNKYVEMTLGKNNKKLSLW